MLALLVLTVLGGCGGVPATDGSTGPEIDPAAVEQTLQRWGEAALAGDRSAFDAEVSTRDPAFAATATRLFDDLGRLGSLRWELGPRRGPLPPTRRGLLGPDAVVAPATVSWTPEGAADTLRAVVWTTWVVEDGAPRLAGTVDGPDTADGPTPSWWVEDVTVQQVGGATVVTGASPDPDLWRERVERALAAVEAAGLDAARPTGPPPSVVVQVPSSRRLAERVAGSAALLEGAAAVTLVDVGGALPVLVDPAAGLSEESWVFLLTHELVHVRTASPGNGSPRWLVEGLAESVARKAQPELLGTSREQAAAAAEVGPLPTDEQLREEPYAAYLCSWVAVELLRQRLGHAGALDVVAATADGRSVADVLAAADVPSGELEREVAAALEDLAAGREVPALR
ncbi:hypothetical protein [Auraticoccus monumenti]|uniref:Peptidase MA superfamily protein n=1 Tax=Auraticoccus monumenti TaxID=675864 RepID=A0A1G7DTX9_9ACTN|nr:hypothetical protein [Auraticoccus monumenti]SDE54630.1 hypothetical protein SAMN04489747_3702 [Auraticoccus monumenti]